MDFPAALPHSSNHKGGPTKYQLKKSQASKYSDREKAIQLLRRSNTRRRTPHTARMGIKRRSGTSCFHKHRHESPPLSHAQRRPLTSRLHRSRHHTRGFSQKDRVLDRHRSLTPLLYNGKIAAGNNNSSVISCEGNSMKHMPDSTDAMHVSETSGLHSRHSNPNSSALSSNLKQEICNLQTRDSSSYKKKKISQRRSSPHGNRQAVKQPQNTPHRRSRAFKHARPLTQRDPSRRPSPMDIYCQHIHGQNLSKLYEDLLTEKPIGKTPRNARDLSILRHIKDTYNPISSKKHGIFAHAKKPLTTVRCFVRFCCSASICDAFAMNIFVTHQNQ